MRNYNHIGGEGSLDKHVKHAVRLKTTEKPAFKPSSAYPSSTQKKIDPSSIRSRRSTLKKKSNSIHPTSSIETSSKPNNKATQTSPYFNEIPTRIKQKKTEKSKGLFSLFSGLFIKPKQKKTKILTPRQIRKENKPRRKDITIVESLSAEKVPKPDEKIDIKIPEKGFFADPKSNHVKVEDIDYIYKSDRDIPDNESSPLSSALPGSRMRDIGPGRRDIGPIHEYDSFKIIVEGSPQIVTAFRDDEAKALYFYNFQTGEASWLPPEYEKLQELKIADTEDMDWDEIAKYVPPNP
jgi:hypothetical protein